MTLTPFKFKLSELVHEFCDSGKRYHYFCDAIECMRDEALGYPPETIISRGVYGAFSNAFPDLFVQQYPQISFVIDWMRSDIPHIFKQIHEQYMPEEEFDHSRRFRIGLLHFLMENYGDVDMEVHIFYSNKHDCVVEAV